MKRDSGQEEKGRLREIHANRFFVETERVSVGTGADDTGNIIITGEDVRHIRDVLRMRRGDRLVLCDGQGNDWLCEISQIDKSSITTGIISCSRSVGEPPVEIVLYQGLPRGDKFDFVIQKCVEVGVTRIVPIICERTQFGADLRQGDKGVKKLQRWRRIALEAAKQSGRGKVPRVEDIALFQEAVTGMSKKSLAIIPYEKELKRTLVSVLRGGERQDTHIFIGPEGGFSEQEVSCATGAGAIPVTLGPRILRTETAGIAVVFAITYEASADSVI